MSEELQPRNILGRAFYAPDNIVRWIIRISRRNLCEILWRDAESDVWHTGQRMRLTNVQQALPSWQEVPAPQLGETIKKAGATGLVEERTIPAPGAGEKEKR